MRTFFLLVALGLFCFFSCVKDKKRNVESDSIGVLPVNEQAKKEILDKWFAGVSVDEQFVLDRLGEPDSIEFDTYWPALGTHFQKWTYIKEGISFLMESAGKDAPKYVVDVFPKDVPTVEEILDNWLGIGVEEQLVLDRLGRPDSLGADAQWGALGTYVQKWEYTKDGIFLEMESDEDGLPKHVLLITIKPPCEMKTQQAVGIGTSRAIVEETYSSLIDRDNTNDRCIVVGSIYGGTIFYFDNGVVNKIFIGAAAE